MRLYSLTGADQIVDPEWGRFTANDDGSFDLPDELAERELTFHHRGRPRWESEIDRQRRNQAADLDARRDPAALFDAVAQLIALAQRAQGIDATPAAPAEVPAEEPPATEPEAEDPLEKPAAEAKTPRGRSTGKRTPAAEAPADLAE